MCQNLLNWHYITIYYVRYVIGWPNCHFLSDFQFSDSFGKLRSFYIKFISITIFYSDSKGSRNSIEIGAVFALSIRED